MKLRKSIILIALLLLLIGCIASTTTDSSEPSSAELENYKSQSLWSANNINSMLQNNQDGGWCLINGPLYLAPYSQLAFDSLTSVYGIYVGTTQGNLAHIESVVELVNHSNQADIWLQVTLQPRGIIKFPALWIRFSDVLEYTEETKAHFTGPFDFKEGWIDPITSMPIRVQVSGQTLTPEEVNRSRDMYITFQSDDFKVRENNLCGKDQGVAQIMWCYNIGGKAPSLSQHVSLSDLTYPDCTKYSSIVFDLLQ